jgi:hypothetical protein
MEARRAFQGGATSSKQIYIVVSALLVALALALAVAYLASRTSASVPAGHSVQAAFQAPDAQERNAQLNSSRNPQPTYRETHGH